MSLEKAKKYLESKGCLELEGVCNAQGWVDVCKTPEG